MSGLDKGEGDKGLERRKLPRGRGIAQPFSAPTRQLRAQGAGINRGNGRPVAHLRCIEQPRGSGEIGADRMGGAPAALRKV